MSDGRTIAYEYDAEERITKVVDSIEGTTEYTYDALGQLLTETTNGTAVNTMVYDSYGNILQKNGKSYVYDEVWKDRLAYYDGKPLTYDAQGNPTEYLGHSLTWEKGRQLKSFDNIQYTYNANGIRTSKTVDGIRHDYLLDGTKILKETWNDDVLEMLYDNEDSVCGIIYNGTPYYFLKNLQGDIIAITNAKGETVARYSYDAWGICNILETESVNGSIANINPFRYRGYYYDEETGFYYLQSRYYNPTVGRFVNSDELEFVNIDINLFVYAYNDPVNEVDPTGCFSFPRAVLSIPLDIAFMALSPYLAPVKAFAKKFAGFALKTRLSTSLINLIKSVAKIAAKILNAIKNIVRKIPFWGKNWAGKINVAKISKSIAGATTSAVFNFILNSIVPNITIFLSVGGFIAGFLDLLSDKKLNNKITIPFVW